MKKFLLTLLVIALATPALADGTVTLSAVANGSDVDIVMTVDAADAGDGPVGFALLVEANAGADLTDTVVVDSFFDIFMDLAFDEENGDGYLYAEGSNAVCKVGAAGQIVANDSAASVAAAMADPARTYAVCAGGLGGESGTPLDPPAQGSSVTLMTISGEAGASGTVDLDAFRGGIVFKAGGTVTVNGLPLAIDFGGTIECILPTDPDYANWVLAGKPESWCNRFNCVGDADNLFSGKDADGKRIWVDSADLTIFLAGWQKNDLDPEKPNWISADCDRLFSGKDADGKRIWVDSADLTIFLAGWQKNDADPIFSVNCPYYVAP